MCLRSKLVHKFVSPSTATTTTASPSSAAPSPQESQPLRPLPGPNVYNPTQTLTRTAVPLGSSHPPHPPPSPHLYPVTSLPLFLPSGSVAPDFLPVWKCEQSSLSLRIKPRPRETKGKEYIKYFRMSSSPLPLATPPPGGGEGSPRISVCYNAALETRPRDKVSGCFNHSWRTLKVNSCARVVAGKSFC